MAAIDESRLEQIVPFAAKVATVVVVAYLDGPKMQQHLYNPMILEELLLKLPQRERREWGRFYKDLAPCPSLKDLSKWLDMVAEEISESSMQYPTTAEAKPNPFSRPVTKAKAHHMLMCKLSNYSTAECYWLSHLHSDERWKAVKEKRLCGYCLGEHHWRHCN